MKISTTEGGKKIMITAEMPYESYKLGELSPKLVCQVRFLEQSEGSTEYGVLVADCSEILKYIFNKN